MKSVKHFARRHFLLLFSLLILTCLLPILYRRNSVHSADERFLDFTNDLFCREVSSNTLTLHYTLSDPSSFGIREPEISFDNYTPGSAGHGSGKLQETLEELKAFPYDQLNSDNQLTYDIVKAQLEAQLTLAPYELYEEIFTPTTGTHAQLPVLLAEYPLESLNDMDIYLDLIKQLPSYYKSLLQFEQEKAAVGLFMWKDTAEKVISQCESFIQNPAENFLITTFEERIRSLPFVSLSQKEAYLLANKSCVLEYVIPAYQDLIAGLEKLKDKGVNAGGLAHYKHGKDYYQAVITATIGSRRSIPEIQELLEERMDTDLRIIQDVLEKNPQPDLEASVESTDFSMSMSILNTLQQRMASDFPAATNVIYEVKQVHPSMEQHLSPAFYLTPRLDDTETHTIYINNSADFNFLSLFTTLAHEGYPGHLYQSLWENTPSSNPVRSLFYFGGYTEGWATYAERMSYAYADMDPDLADLLAANNAVSLGIYALADIGVHDQGWSLSQTQEFLSDYGVHDASVAKNIFEAVRESPANYLKYYLGYVEIEKLREQANAALHHKFNLKDFHTFLLSTGPAPFSVLEDRLQIWIKSYSH